MSNVVEGKVEVLMQNKGKFWTIKMDDGQWYGCGKERPKFDKGDTIRFETVTNGRYLNVNEETVEVVTDAPAPRRSPAPTSAPKKFSTEMSKDDYWRRKEERDLSKDEVHAGVQKEIRLQASRNAAIELMSVAIQAGLLPDVVEEKKKKGTRFDILLTYVDKLTQKFYNETAAISAVAKDSVAEEEGEDDDAPAAGDAPNF